MDWSYPPEKSTYLRETSPVLELSRAEKEGKATKILEKKYRRGSKKGRKNMGRTEGFGSE